MQTKEQRTPVFFFGWPSALGGADTKLAHLIILLHQHIAITVVPNENRHLHGKPWIRFLEKYGAKYCMLDKLPKKLEGYGISLSNDCFFVNKIAERAKERGLKVIWSSEMMWHHKGELEAVKMGLIDKVLYTSELQKGILEPGYGSLPGSITGNYIDSDSFPFKERSNAIFTIGRLSRPAPEKYPEDFPVFYECLQLPEVRFRVMAWSEQLTKKYRWHKFDRRWDLLRPEAEGQTEFLQSLDLFIYPLGHNFRESWGRSTVEAMLTGCIPLVPPGHHLENLLVHEGSGYICRDFKEYQHYSQKLFYDYPLRKTIASQCHEHAVTKLCNKEEHLKIWLEVFR